MFFLNNDEQKVETKTAFCLQLELRLRLDTESLKFDGTQARVRIVQNNL